MPDQRAGAARLADPFRVVAGPADAAELLPRCPPVRREEMGANVHPVERAYEALKEALRAVRA